MHLLDPTPEDRKRRWLALGFSPLLQAIGLSLLVWSTTEQPSWTSRVLGKREALIFHLIAPPSLSRQFARALRSPPTARLARKPIVREPPRWEVRQAVAERLPALSNPQPVRVLPKLPPVLGPTLPANVVPATPKQAVAKAHTGVFPASNPAMPPLKLPLRQVQTGGFGDPNGFTGEALGGSRGNVAKLGSFNLPYGPGQGNGSGATQGSRGVVATAGFGNGITAAGVTQAQNGSHLGRVQQGGFGDVVPRAYVPKAEPPSPTSALEPVVILSKPKPAYPEEARRLRLEGEVVLSVVFGASGKLRLLRVVRGLGHGMDEAAIHAAEQILFKPARRDGHPVDFEATVRITFELAY